MHFFIFHPSIYSVRLYLLVAVFLSSVTVHAQISSTLIPYRQGNKWGYCDQQKTIVTPCVYTAVELFQEGMAAVQQNKQWGFVDATGKLVIPCIYDKVLAFKHNTAQVKNKTGYFHINKQGQRCKPESIADTIIMQEGYNEEEVRFRTKQNGKWGFTNGLDKVVIPCIYDDVDGFVDNRSIVTLNGKDGLIDLSGKEIAPCIYNFIQPFHEGKALVSISPLNSTTCYGLLDMNGKQTLLCGYDYVFPFTNGYARVIKNGKTGYVNGEGEPVIPCKYLSGTDFNRQGLALVSFAADKTVKQTYITADGTEYCDIPSPAMPVVANEMSLRDPNEPGVGVAIAPPPPAEAVENVFAAVTKEAAYPGGVDSFTAYIRRGFSNIDTLTTAGFSGKLVVSFTIGKTGEVNVDGINVYPSLGSMPLGIA